MTIRSHTYSIFTLLVYVTQLSSVTGQKCSTQYTCGCTDPKAKNYNQRAAINDGSCAYATNSIRPQSSYALTEALKETSGLIAFDDYLLTHNDDTDTRLYCIEKSSGTIVSTFTIPGVKNNDWEALTQDDNYIYIGDFGNNGNGARTSLAIYKVLKSSLQSVPEVTTIAFDYEGRLPTKKSGSNATDYDCEAFIAVGDSLYLFTKEWNTEKTTVYVLPKKAGNTKAKKCYTYPINGLITDASYNKKNNCVVLSGYSKTLQPFIYLLYDFRSNYFFSGMVRRFKVSLPFHQIEGVTLADDYKLYLTNEAFSRKFIATVPAQLHVFSLKNILFKE